MAGPPRRAHHGLEGLQLAIKGAGLVVHLEDAERARGPLAIVFVVKHVGDLGALVENCKSYPDVNVCKQEPSKVPAFPQAAARSQ